ncbi:MAG: hypothetical protein NT106_01355 [Candidatus Sumerlaeota bacterium]|nr:hypothetical protein [Candidatus Sumerlaeota bacterium]
MDKDKKFQEQMKRRAVLPALILGALGGVLLLRHKPYFHIPWWFCLYLLAGIAVHPAILRPADAVARTITKALVWTTSRLFLGFVYFCIITPIGLWFRLRGRDRLLLKFPADSDSFWHRRPEEEQTPKFDKQY